MRQYIERPHSNSSRNILRTIANNGLNTWLDLANLLHVYINRKIYVSLPQELQPLKVILDTNKPDWQLERKVIPDVLSHPLPESIIGSLRLLCDRYQQHPPSWLSIHCSLRHALLAILNDSLQEEPQNDSINTVNDATYDKQGFITNAVAILQSIRSEFNQRHTKSFCRIHQISVNEVLSACLYITRNLHKLSSKRDLVNLITDPALTNVPYHAELHATNQSNMVCLTGIVNSLISAYRYFNSHNKLYIFFTELYGGFCIEGRLRQLFETYSQHETPELRPSFESQINEKTRLVVWYLISTGKKASMDNITALLFDCLKNQLFKPDQHYLPSGHLTNISSIQRYAQEALQYKEFLAITDPDTKKGDISIGISLFQAIIRGMAIRRHYYFDTPQTLSSCLVTEINVRRAHQTLVEQRDFAASKSVAAAAQSLFQTVPSYFSSFFQASHAIKQRESSVYKKKTNLNTSDHRVSRVFVHPPNDPNSFSDVDYVIIKRYS